MKRALLLLILLNEGCTGEPRMVCICTGPNAKKYHYHENCRGLSNCTYKVAKITQDEAESKGRQLCKWEK